MAEERVARIRAALAPQEHAVSFAVTLMEHLVVPTFVLDAEQRVLIWNRACERLTGIAAAAVLGTRDHWQAFYAAPRPCLADLVCRGDYGEIDRLYTLHDDPGQPAFGVHAENWCNMPRRGERLYLAVDAGPVYDEHGKLIAVVETLRDMTERQLAQTRVREQADLLKAHYDRHLREAELARRILEYQIRSDLLSEAGVEHKVVPATHFSGDMVLAARSPSGRLYAILADATGHGLAAAVSVLPMVQEFYRLVELDQPLVAMIESINFLLANSLPVGRFVAAAFVCLDEEKRRGDIWVGGIPEVLLLDTAGRVNRRFPSRNLPLGVSRGNDGMAAVESFDWQASGHMLLLSDGVIEASGSAGSAFGAAGLEQQLLAGGPCLGAILDAVDRFLQGQPAHDDMSLLLLALP